MTGEIKTTVVPINTPHKAHMQATIMSDMAVVHKLLKSRDDPKDQLEEGDYEYHEPPYEPQDLVDLMSMSITHARCVKTKAADAAGIGYKIVGSDLDKLPSPESIKTIREFVRHIHRRLDLNTILEEAVKDRESIGWSVIEVIRNVEGKVARLEPVPAHSIRVLKGNHETRATFVQISDTMPNVYFQEFPDKYVDGKPNFIDADDGKTPMESVLDSATELIFWQKTHTSATRWYGLPDIIPASGDLEGIRKIRDRFLSFFDNSCIPRHAIVIRGAEVTPEVQQTIETYFKTNFKGDPHRTLILSSDDPEFDVKFHKVEVEQVEADYRGTRKDLRDFIRLAHGIPPSILGIEGGSSVGAGSGISQAENYMNRIVTPTQRGLHKILDDIVEFGLGIKDAVIRLEKPDIRDLNLEMRRDTQYLSHGVFSVNDILKAMGRPIIPGGDKHYVWSRRTAPQEVGGETKPIKKPDTPYGADREAEGGSGGGGGAVSDMNRA